MVRVVLDAVNFVRALLNPRSTWGRLVFDYADRFRLVVSPAIVDEVVGVLTRPKIANRLSDRPNQNVAAIQGRLASAESINLGIIPRISRDPKDDIYPATAAAAGASYVVSEDRDLLDLGAYEGVRMIDAETFLRLLDKVAVAER